MIICSKWQHSVVCPSYHTLNSPSVCLNEYHYIAWCLNTQSCPRAFMHMRPSCCSKWCSRCMGSIQPMVYSILLRTTAKVYSKIYPSPYTLLMSCHGNTITFWIVKSSCCWYLWQCSRDHMASVGAPLSHLPATARQPPLPTSILFSVGWVGV